MNILAINSINNFINFSSTQKNKKTNNFMPFAKIQLTKPLDKDTISFKAKPTEKLLRTRSGGVSMKIALNIYEEAKIAQEEILDFMIGLHKGYICNPQKQNNLIQVIKGRTKKPDSIVEKSKIIQEDSKERIFQKMTDLNGTKEVIRDASRKNVHKALNILLKAIESKLLILEEVEVKRPKAAAKLKASEASKWDYADPEFLADFVEKAEKAMQRSISFPKPQHTAVNYTAIHFLLRLPGGRVFEHQLMGSNVSKLKDLDDILFKVLNNKNVDKRYAPIVEILKPLILSPQEIDLLKYIKLKNKLEKLKFTEEEIEILKSRHTFSNSFCVISDPPGFCAKTKMLTGKDFDETALDLLSDDYIYDAILADTDAVKELKKKADRFEKFKSYRAQAFLFQREKKTANNSSEHQEYFLPLTEDLPQEFDLNNLYKLYDKCNKVESV